VILNEGDEEESEEDAAITPEGRRVEDEEVADEICEGIERVEDGVEVAEEVAREELLEGRGDEEEI